MINPVGNYYHIYAVLKAPNHQANVELPPGEFCHRQLVSSVCVIPDGGNHCATPCWQVLMGYFIFMQPEKGIEMCLKTHRLSQN